jgi:hypothetical protein
VPELANTIMRDLPRLRDTEAISRDSSLWSHLSASPLRNRCAMRRRLDGVHSAAIDSTFSKVHSHSSGSVVPLYVSNAFE